MLAKSHIGTLLGVLFCVIIFTGCYSFKGISIPTEAQTFYVTDLENRIPTAPSDLGQLFSEALKQKFINESRLNFSDLDPDIEFSGQVSRFAVTSVAPQPGESIAFNRLEISVRIKYDYSLDEENNWENTFTFFQDYSRDQNLLDIQDGLITVIFTQLTEDIFNKAFTNW